jgi:arginase
VNSVVMAEMEIALIGVPIDLGAGRRGVDMGPSAIRYAGLQEGLTRMGHRVHDAGDLPVEIPETRQVGSDRLKYLDVVLPVLEAVREAVSDAVAAGRMPLCLGGDHSIALGSIAGSSRGRALGVIWLDAHADFNTADTTPSGNIHGMPLAALCGYGDPRLVAVGRDEGRKHAIDPRRVAVVGARSLDGEERRLLRQAGVSVFSMDAIDRFGIAEVMRQAIAVASRDTRGIHLSLDVDGVDPMYAPGVGTPVAGGLTYREAHLAVELIAESGRLVGLDLVEVNPILDSANATGLLAVQLALSAMGLRVWDGPPAA